MTRLSHWIFVPTLVVVAVGCSCEDKPQKKGAPAVTPPLAARPVPSELGARLVLAEGTRTKVPVAVVLATEARLCDEVASFAQRRLHVVCSDAPPADADRRLKKALSYLHEQYTAYVAGPPVWFFVDSSRAEIGFQLTLQEPSFFSYVYVAGLKETSLSATTLSALHDRGAESLVVASQPNDRVKVLTEVAGRRGLTLRVSPQASVGEALDLFAQQDARLAAPSAAKAPKN